MAKSKKTKSAKEQKKSDHKITNYSHVQDTMQIIYGVKDAVEKGIEFMKNVEKKMDLCYDKNAPSIVLDVKEYKNGYIDIKKRSGKIRVITEITQDNIEYCKELMKIVDELRHLDNVQGGTAINENEYMATNILHESKPLTQVIYSNVRDIVEQQQKFFDSLWKTAIPAKQKIRECSRKLNRRNNDVFTTLSNEIRRSIIFYLYEEDLTMSQLSKKLKMTLQAMQKHLPKLVETGIIEKKDGTMSLTQIGFALANQIPSVEFLSDNNSYLKTHSLSSLPSQFLQRIGDLEKFEMVSKLENNEKYADFLDEAEEYVKILSPQNHFDFDTTMISDMLKKKIRISQISDENTVHYVNRIKEQKKPQQDKSKSGEIFNKKIIKDVPLVTCVSENSACLVFLQENGSVNFDNVMWSKDQKFISWCNDFFDYTWKLM